MFNRLKQEGNILDTIGALGVSVLVASPYVQVRVPITVPYKKAMELLQEAEWLLKYQISLDLLAMTNA